MVDKAISASPEYWRARAEGLAALAETLEMLVLLLAAQLPPDQVTQVVNGVRLRETVLLPESDAAQPMWSDVKTELDRLWASLLPDGPE